MSRTNLFPADERDDEKSFRSHRCVGTKGARRTSLSLSLSCCVCLSFSFSRILINPICRRFHRLPFATSKRSRENRYLYLLIANSRDSSSSFPALVLPLLLSPLPLSCFVYPPSIPRSSGIPKHLDLLNAKCSRQTMLNRDVAPRCNPRCYRCRREEREKERGR